MVVVGASAGGVEALTRLLSGLPADLPAAVAVVLHTSPDAPGHLANVLGRACALPVAFAARDEALEAGRVYVAPADRHLLLVDERVRTARGPRENRARPAIDPLFRSAAVAYGTRTIGVVLSGMQDDGSSGLSAIARCGGTTVVQDPADAAFPDMPANALRAAEVDHCLPLAEMPALLTDLAHRETAPGAPPPRDVVFEAGIAARAMSDVPKENALGSPAPYGCPECGGPMWEIDDAAVPRFRCHVGHGYTATTLLAEQDGALERALWVALRTLEERARILRRLTTDARANERTGLAERYAGRAAEAEEHVDAVRRLLLEGEGGAPESVDDVPRDLARSAASRSG